MSTDKKEETFDHGSKVTNSEQPVDAADIYDFAAAKFSVGQKVFANDTGNVYEAVIRKSMIRTEPHHHWAYFVHYLGWNSRWDKWMTEDSIEEDTLEVRSRAQKVKEEAKKVEILKKEKKRESEREKKERKLRKTKKQKTSSDGDNDDSDLSLTCRDIKKMSIKDILTSCCELPFTLKTVLMDDREKINTRMKNSSTKREGMKPNLIVHKLPASISVQLIIAQFVKIKSREINENAKPGKDGKETETQDDSSSKDTSKNSTTDTDSENKVEKWKSFERGILNLFDEMLPKYLLYNQEREQYLNLYRSVNDSIDTLSPSELYPGEFLLRMMVRLPLLLSTSLRVKMMCDDKPSYGELRDLGDRLKQLIVFLQKNRVPCFKGRYRYMNKNKYTSTSKSTVMRSNAA